MAKVRQASIDKAAERLTRALGALASLEAKAGLNPQQPRTPAGNGAESGRWFNGLLTAFGQMQDGLGISAHRTIRGLDAAADQMMHGLGKLYGPGFQAALDAAPPPVRRFLLENRAAIERTLGAAQAAGGIPQMVEGSELLGTGAATLPEGAPLVAVGAFMVAHGYDDWETGLRTLATGQAEPGGFYNLLRESGFNDNAAQLAMAATAGLPASAVRTLSRGALESAADAVLERNTLAVLSSQARTITADGSSVFDQVDIMRRGLIAEAYDLTITGPRRRLRASRRSTP